MKYIVMLMFIAVLTGCSRQNKVGEVTGWKPVYITEAELKTITSAPPEPITNGGKIVYATGKIYMVEQGSGVHIINYTNPQLPVKERFIKVPGCYEVTFKNNYLIVNNGADLVTLDISQPQTVTVAARATGIFESIQESNSVPPNAVSGDYFECPELAKGFVLQWEKTTISNPACKVQGGF